MPKPTLRRVSVISLVPILSVMGGCATPAELREPPSGPAFSEPVETPELPAYRPPIPHEAPRSDRVSTPRPPDRDRK